MNNRLKICNSVSMVLNLCFVWRLDLNSTSMMIKTFAAAVHGIDAATISVETDVARVGGGTYPQPDEILLVHNGVLFLG